MIAEVPTMAITLVRVLENTSALADEYIVHRLGLIPLHSENVDRFVFPQDCDQCDDHCSNCAVTFTLNVTCAAETQTVTSRDLTHDSTDHDALAVRPVHDSGDVEPKPQPLVEIHQRLKEQQQQERAAAGNHPGAGSNKEDDGLSGIVIVRMSKGQKLHMKCLVRKGIGKDHAKHSPMCTVAYRIFPPAVELQLDRINALFPHEAKKKLVEVSCGLLFLDNSTDQLKYEQPFLRGRIAVHPDTCRKAGELAVINGGKAHEVVQLNPEPKYFDFVAETTGAMTPRQALVMALRILEEKAGNILAHLNT